MNASYTKFPFFPRNTDIDATRRESVIRLPIVIENWATKHLIEDPRDVIMVSLIANIMCSSVPLIAALYFYPSHLLGLCVVLFNYITYLQRYILMLHYAEHRRLFQHPYHTVLSHLLPTVMCLIFGIPPGMYRLHHVVMHHIENNVFNEDLSSTEPYQRDSVLHFLAYFVRYYFYMALLPLYALRKQRYGMAAGAAGGLVCWLSALSLGLNYAPVFTLWAGLVPALVTGLALMFGNFSQHIFVHPDIASMPQNLKSYQINCALTVQLMNHEENQLSFNDGYHVTHHVNSQVHWSDMPGRFVRDLSIYAENGVLVFQGLGWASLGILVLSGQWEALSDHYVPLTLKGEQPPSRGEIVAMLKARVQPVHRDNRSVTSTGTPKASLESSHTTTNIDVDAGFDTVPLAVAVPVLSSMPAVVLPVIGMAEVEVANSDPTVAVSLDNSAK